MTLGLIHLISIPVDNTSVNPARSFASALFAGSDAFEQLWAFVVFPLIGGVLGAMAWKLIDDSDELEPGEA
jgi:aquaporin Z